MIEHLPNSGQARRAGENKYPEFSPLLPKVSHWSNQMETKGQGNPGRVAKKGQPSGTYCMGRKGRKWIERKRWMSFSESRQNYHI